MKPSAFLTAALLIGCGTDEATDDQLVAAEFPPVEVVAHDCSPGLPGEPILDSFTPNLSGVYVVGIYGARWDDPWWLHDDCNACVTQPGCKLEEVCADRDGVLESRAEPASVHVGRGVTTLVVTSLLPTTWTITASPDSSLTNVIVSGSDCGYLGTAIVPEGVTVETRPIGYAWWHYTDDEVEQTCEQVMQPTDPYVCDVDDLGWKITRLNAAIGADLFLEAVEAHTGEPLGGFYGCHELTTMTIGEVGPDHTNTTATE